jgi:hypothetical protein
MGALESLGNVQHLPGGGQRFVVPIPEESLNGANANKFVEARKRKRTRGLAFLIGRSYLAPIDGKALLRATFVYPVRRRRDEEGLRVKLKGLIDGLVDAGTLEDDDLEHLRVEVDVRIQPGTRALEITLEPATPPARDGRATA